MTPEPAQPIQSRQSPPAAHAAGASAGPLSLNRRAAAVFDELAAQTLTARLARHELPGGGQLIDAGIDVPGGLAAGLMLARLCLADLAEVQLVPSVLPGTGMAVSVWTDHPVAACLSSQYAGWRLASGKFFAMGSGPMRAAADCETLFDDIGHRERADVVVGALETRKQPPAEIVAQIAERCRVPGGAVRLVVAPTASQAGTLQVVARSLETALHKLHELKYDVARIESGWGTAPLPPTAADDLGAIGRTNDAVLYGGEVTLWLRDDDERLVELGPRIPSSASPQHGAPFSEIFRGAGGDFYQIDPLLFSPAVVRLVNLTTGNTFSFGRLVPEVLAT